jgi:hypothetical protein
LGPAPRTSARERMMMMRKTTILISDVTYSNHAKILFGRVNMAKQAKRKIETRSGV